MPSHSSYLTPPVATSCHWLALVATSCRWLALVATSCHWWPLVGTGWHWLPIRWELIKSSITEKPTLLNKPVRPCVVFLIFKKNTVRIFDGFAWFAKIRPNHTSYLPIRNNLDCKLVCRWWKDIFRRLVTIPVLKIKTQKAVLFLKIYTFKMLQDFI